MKKPSSVQVAALVAHLVSYLSRHGYAVAGKSNTPLRNIVPPPQAYACATAPATPCRCASLQRIEKTLDALQFAAEKTLGRGFSLLRSLILARNLPP